jgi:toxin HigB-1
MILSFGDKDTEDLFHGRKTRGSRRFAGNIRKAALRKLDMINAAANLDDLRSPPGNRLEQLKGDWKGWHSVRVNDQFRIVFRWIETGANEVRIVDYH